MSVTEAVRDLVDVESIELATRIKGLPSNPAAACAATTAAAEGQRSPEPRR